MSQQPGTGRFIFGAHNLKNHANQTVQVASTSHAAQIMYRLGYAAKGVVYLLIGGLALAMAIGMGGSIKDPQGILSTIERQPFGDALLLLLGFCMLGYVCWRFAQAFLNVEHLAHEGKNTIKRIGFAISGFIHLSLAYMAIKGGLESNVQQGAGGGRAMFTSRALEMPGGRWLVAAAGICFMGVGVYQIYRGLSKRFMRSYDSRLMSGDERKAVKTAGMIGLPARGVTFVMIGYFLMLAGIRANPGETKGMADAMSVLSQSYGYLALGAIAIGFIVYAMYCFSTARFKKFA